MPSEYKSQALLFQLADL